MDLLRALDVLSTSAIDSEDQALRKEKIEACRTIAEQICSPSIRNTTDFPRYLAIAISLLLRVHGDKDLNVYSVAEESLNRTIKVLIYTSHERILFELFRVIKGRTVESASTTSPTSATPSSSTSTTPGSKRGSFGSDLVTPPVTPALSNTINSPSSSSNSSQFPNNLLSNANGILSKPFPLKSQRIALTKFGEVCHFIRPKKSRKYITSLFAPINHLLSVTSDEALQEALANAMESISRVLISHLKEQEVTQFIDIFIRNLACGSAAVRRSASFAIVSIIRHYPKQHQLLDQVIDTLFNFIYNSTTVIADHPSNKTLGVLFTYLQLVRLFDVEQQMVLQQSPSNINTLTNIYTSRLPFFLQMISKNLKLVYERDTYDHNVVGASLELLQQLLTSLGKYEYCWPVNDIFTAVVSQLDLLAFNTQSVRVSLRAVVINCLAQTVKYFPKLFFTQFFKDQQPQQSQTNNLTVSDISFKLFSLNNQQQNNNNNNQNILSSSTHSTTSLTSSTTVILDDTPKEVYLKYLNDQDPLLRGSTALLIGCLIRGFLEVDHATSNDISPHDHELLQDYIPIPYLVAYLLRSLLDQSSITAKLSCTGIGECLATLSRSKCSEWSLVALRHLLCVSSSTYWLVKLEILETLSKIDYVIIEYLEQNFQHKSQILSFNQNNENNQQQQQHQQQQSVESGGAIAMPIQPKVLGFLIDQLGDNDFRVRNSAGNALVNIIPNLVFTAPLERHTMKGIASIIKENFDVQNIDNINSKKSKILSNLSHVIGLIVNKLSNPHPEDMIRGCYHALKLICQVYSFPLGTPAHCRTLNSSTPNQMLSFVGDILPLALDRIGIITWIATDFDVHIDIVEILGYLSRGTETIVGSYSHNVMRHLCRIINIMSNIIQFKPTPPLKETKPNSMMSSSGIVSNGSTGMGGSGGVGGSGGNSNSPLIKSSQHPGSFTHSVHYIKIYARLLQARINSMTTIGTLGSGMGSGGGGGFGMSGGESLSGNQSSTMDKFSQLRQACLDSLAVIIKCSGKSILPYCEELIGYLTSHFEQEPLSVTKCITELFLVTFKPTPLVSMSNASLSSTATNRLSREFSLKSIHATYEPRSVDELNTTGQANQHDELFSNSKSIYSTFLTLGTPSPHNTIPNQPYEPVTTEIPSSSQSLNYSYSNQEVNRIVNSEDKKHIFKLFEPLIASCMLEYQTTHSLDLKQEILLMLSKFSRFGLDLQQFDKEQQFPTYILDELRETESLLRYPYQVLPYIYDLIGSVFLTRRQFPDVIHVDEIKMFLSLFDSKSTNIQPLQLNQQQQQNNPQLQQNGIDMGDIGSSSKTTYTPVIPSYPISSLIGSLASFSKYLFDPNDKYPEVEVRDQLMNLLLSHFYLEEAIDLAITIVTHIKSNTPLYLKYSQLISQKLFNCLALSETSYFMIQNIESLHRIYTLLDRLHPNSVTPSRWCDALLSASPTFIQSPKSFQKNDPLQQQTNSKRSLSPREQLLDKYELKWLPPLVIILRIGVRIPEETRISSARQSLYLSYHDNKSAPSPSATIISQLIFKLIRNAIITFDATKPTDTIFTQLINHMLFYASLFFNKSLTPNPSKPGLFLSSIRQCIDQSFYEQISTPLLKNGGTSTAIHAARFLMTLHSPLGGVNISSTVTKGNLVSNGIVEAWKNYVYSKYWQRCSAEHYCTHHVLFLMYCQYLIVYKVELDDQETLNSTFLDKVVLHINEGTIKKFIEMIKHSNKPSNMARLYQHLSDILRLTNSNSLDQRKKQKLLRLLSFLPANKETLEMLIVNFLQTDDISLQIAGENILNLNINTLIDTYGPRESLGVIQHLYTLFMSNFYKSSSNLAIQALFEKLIKNLSTMNEVQQQEKQLQQEEQNNLKSLIDLQLDYYNSQSGQSNLSSSTSDQLNYNLKTIPYSYYIEFISSQYYIDGHHAFNHLSVLSQIDKEAMKRLLCSEDSKLDYTLVPMFISSPYAQDYEQELLQHIERRLDGLFANQTEEHLNVASDPLRMGPPQLTDTLWDELRELIRSLTTFINRFGLVNQGTLEDSRLLKIAVWAFVEGFKRWRAEVINPYDFKLILELSKSIIVNSSASILTITDDYSWCSLLLCLYKFYCLVIRPHFGFISGQRELEENYSQDPTQISLTQSNEMIKFLVSLLNSRRSYKPINGSHIGQFIFDSFMASLIPLASKAMDFIYPTISTMSMMSPQNTMSSSSLDDSGYHGGGGYDDEFGGGIIPNCPLFSQQLQPEQNLRAFVGYINYVGLVDDVQFDQIWRILEPIFVAPLGDAEIGTDEITEESKCLALNGIVLMIIKSCFETANHSNTPVNLLDTATIPPFQYHNVPREKDLVFLSTASGKKVNHLQSIIYAALPQSELPCHIIGTSNTSKIDNTLLSINNAYNINNSNSMNNNNNNNMNQSQNQISPYHFNIERGWNSNNHYMSGQISLKDIKQFKVPQHIGINFTPIIEKLIQTFESFLVSTMCPPLLKKNIIGSIVLLSDVFNRDQYLWMFRVFYGMYNTLNNEDFDDFLLKQHLVLGYIKSLCVIHPQDLQFNRGGSGGSSDHQQHTMQIYDMLKSSLEHSNISLQQSALDAILYLLEGKISRYIYGPLLQFLFKWIPARLTTSPLPPIPLVLRALSVMFLIIEQYSRESEENSFTKKAVLICTTLGQSQSTPLPIIYGIFRGLDRLLVSFSLSHAQREYISYFALKALPLENPIRSMLGLGLMVTCMYTGDETLQSSLTPSINSNTKNSMMSSPPTTPLSYGNVNSGITPLDSPLTFSTSEVNFPSGGGGSGNSIDDDILSQLSINNDDKHISQINNMEKVKMLFDKIKMVSHYTYESFILSEVIPTIIVDIYPSVDQILSFILGEFLKQSKSNPKLMCQIVSKVFHQLLEKDASNQQLIDFWIILCLQNFFQIQNPVHCQWCLINLFLCSSPSKSLQLLSSEFSSKIQSNDKLFLIAASEFYFNDTLSKENKQLFIDSFSRLKNQEPYQSLVTLLLSTSNK